MGRPTTNERGQIQRTNGEGGGERSRDQLGHLLVNELGPQIKLALPKHLDADRMARVALTALRTTPKLADCDKWSFAACILQAAQLGLEVNTPLGHAYLIPREMQVPGAEKGVKRMTCTMQLGYQGMIELARRSGQISTLFAFTVHEGDHFEYELGLDPKLVHRPNLEGPPQTEQNMRFVYAVAALRSGPTDRQFVVLSKRNVTERKARGAGGPAWRTDFLAMARKSAVRALFTFLPKSPEMARAERIDDHDPREALSSVIDTSVAEQLSSMHVDVPPQGQIITEGDDDPIAYLRSAQDADAFMATVKANAAWIATNGDESWPVIRERAAELKIDTDEIDLMLAEEAK